jgi:hypothetical protein
MKDLILIIVDVLDWNIEMDQQQAARVNVLLLA